MSDAPLLELRGLDVTFPTRAGDVHAVRGLDMLVGPGEVVGVVGESGSGKSVAMSAVMGLLPRHARVTGSVLFRGEELVGRPTRDLRRLRGAQLAMVFQDPMTALNPVLPVGRQIAEAIRSHQDVSKKQAHGRAVELLESVGVPGARRRAGHYPHEFSGGMRQRALIAMAIANDPDVLILDEATTALDVTVQAQVLELVAAIQQRTRCAVLLVSHDLGVVAGLADRVVVMYAGRPVEVGTVDEIFYAARHPYTRGLLAATPRLDDDGQRTRLVRIEGQPPSPLALPSGCPFHPRCPLSTGPGGVCTDMEPGLLAVSATQVSACHFAADLDSRIAERAG